MLRVDGAVVEFASKPVDRRCRPRSRDGRRSRSSGRAAAARPRCCARSAVCSRSTGAGSRGTAKICAAVPHIGGGSASCSRSTRSSRIATSPAMSSFGLRMAGIGREDRRTRVPKCSISWGWLPWPSGGSPGSREGSSSVSRSHRALAVEPRLLDARRAARVRPAVAPRALLARSARSSTARTTGVVRDARSRRSLRARGSDRRYACGPGGAIGRPADVWRRPADEWTANFLGFGPAVDGEITAAGVSTPWGEFPLRAAGEPGAVRVVLRLTLCASIPPVPCLVASSDRAFAGDHTELTVVAAGAPVRVRVPETKCPRSATRSTSRSTKTACSCSRRPDGSGRLR